MRRKRLPAQAPAEGAPWRQRPTEASPSAGRKRLFERPPPCLLFPRRPPHANRQLPQGLHRLGGSLLGL